MNTNILILRYILFALLATIVNLAVQRSILWFGNSLVYLALAIFFGTFAGLVLKFMLDKRWIFYDLSSEISKTTTKFYRYSIMGVSTTILFWGTETAFWFVWKTEVMRELGAIIGLTIGYTLKYQLDKHFVFREKLH